MLFVRRTAPEGSYFEDGDRAAGVFGVISTGFAILLGFVVFLAFESYDTSRTRRRDRGRGRGTAVPDGPAPSRRPPGEPLSEALVCYARSVVYTEWPADAGRGLREPDQPVERAMFRTLQTIEPQTASEQAAYGKWLDQQIRPPGRPAPTARTAPRA